jgi:aldehyde:ferredoxin oxidoreductase
VEEKDGKLCQGNCRVVCRGGRNGTSTVGRKCQDPRAMGAGRTFGLSLGGVITLTHTSKSLGDYCRRVVTLSVYVE